jgi:hypothetical protein
MMIDTKKDEVPKGDGGCIQKSRWEIIRAGDRSVIHMG